MDMQLPCIEPAEISWIGQTEIWPDKEQKWQAKRLEIHRKYRPWAQSIALQLYAKYCAQGTEPSDYLQDASIGLLEAIDRYKPHMGVPFKAYAKKRIKGAILNSIAKYSEYASLASFQKRTVNERVSSILVKDANADAQAGENLINVISGLAIGFLIEDFQTEQEVSLAHAVYSQTELGVLHARILNQIDLLPCTQRIVVQAHYKDGKGFSDIAKNLGLSSGRVSQIHKQAILGLRKKLGW